MRTDRIIFGSLALATTLVVSACSSTQQLAQRDDLYNNQAKAPHDYESPDYYYTDAGSQNEAYNEQAYQDENYEDGGYYADEYSDEEYVEGTEYDSNLEYANRINRFYYGAPGIPYYDPWFDPWYGYAGFGLGFGYGGWGSSWSLGFGFGSPYYGYGWGSPLVMAAGAVILIGDIALGAIRITAMVVVTTVAVIITEAVRGYAPLTDHPVLPHVMAIARAAEHDRQ